jgi:hypothetical protein
LVKILEIEFLFGYCRAWSETRRKYRFKPSIPKLAVLQPFKGIEMRRGTTQFLGKHLLAVNSKIGRVTALQKYRNASWNYTKTTQFLGKKKHVVKIACARHVFARLYLQL